jgi:tRNA-guanine transglycosylase
VKSLTPEELTSLGVQLFFVNTYHTYLRPGLAVIKKFGGLHGFMGWQGPIITDSGGFQVFSLAKPKYAVKGDRDEEGATLVKIDENGVEFRSHWDGSLHYFTPESSMQYQWTLGSDIHIAFDECTTYPTTEAYARAAMERTHRWAVRSLAEQRKLAARAKRGDRPYQALYGVVQGSVFEGLRKESARFMADLPTDGIAIGGVSVGETKKEMRDVLSWVPGLLPSDKPRHLLGVGEFDDIFALVEAGMDTFDCVQPTRLARMGRLYDGKRVREGSDGTMDITKVGFRTDNTPLVAGCTCYTCRHYSRAYLHHLFRVRELLGYRLATMHNLHTVLTLTQAIRESLKEGTFLELKKRWLYNR